MNQQANQSNVDWRDKLAFLNELRQIILQRKPRTEDARELADLAFQRACIACMVEEHASEAPSALAEGAATGAAAVLCHVSAGGWIEIAWSDETTRNVPARPVGVSPATWMRALGCALAIRDADAVDVLCHLPHIGAIQLPEDLGDPFWPFVCGTLAACVLEPEGVPALAEDAEQMLQADLITRGDPAAVLAQMAPLIAVVRAIASGSDNLPNVFAEAWERRQNWYASRGPSSDPLQLMSLELLGLASLAFDRGRGNPLSQLPAAIVAGKVDKPLIRVTRVYQKRWARLPEDPMGFLDLEGFPRERWRHTLAEKDGELVAIYQMSRPGIPHASVEMVLADEAPPALDPAERMLAAELNATRSTAARESGNEPQARAYLTQAVQMVDAVLTAIPAGQDRVPDSSITSERGLQMLEREPGRFRVERLQAYRNGIAAQVSAPEIDDEARRQEEFRLATLGSAEIVKQSVMPLLFALAKDKDGSLRSGLRPHPEDYGKVFQPEAVETARSVYEKMWRHVPDMTHEVPDDTDVVAYVAPAGMFLSENELSRHFPGGYRGIAHMLQPHRVWVYWRYVPKGAKTGGVTYDGLVWCDDHWSWFPKPYRALHL